MPDFQRHVMLALLPTSSEWCHITLPHMTLVYAGKMEELSAMAHNELAKAALSLALVCPAMTLDTLGADVFGGDEEEVEVIRLKSSPELLAMRSKVEHWNASEHPFNPHVTVGPVGSIGDTIPTRISFDRIMVAWGYDNLTYKLQEDWRSHE